MGNTGPTRLTLKDTLLPTSTSTSVLPSFTATYTTIIAQHRPPHLYLHLHLSSTLLHYYLYNNHSSAQAVPFDLYV